MNSKLTQSLLAVIAAALLVIALRPYAAPAPVHADDAADPFWFEPGVYALRIPQGGQAYGKVAINLRTGNLWGFPTNSSDPYPVSPLDAKPLTSRPMPLGRFVLSEAR